MKLNKLTLRKGKTDAVKRFHPWIFSGAIQQKDAAIADGDLVEVLGHDGEFLAIGFYNSSTIAVKILSFEPIEDLAQLFLSRLQTAQKLRETIGLAHSSHTNAYRLINSEGDGIPGLIVDWYDGNAVLLCYHRGIHQHRSLLVEVMRTALGNDLQAIYDKSATVLPEAGIAEYLWGKAVSTAIREHGHRFQVDWEQGQKTGFFLDQRENRQRLQRYTLGKTVLNTFCYSGGFSVYALQGGATMVHSVDISAKAIGWASENVKLNFSDALHECFVSDIFSFLKQSTLQYDVIVLDPPAFAKNLSSRHQAVMAYKRLHQLAFDRLEPGGIVATFSCSQVVSAEHFLGAITAAAIESGRQVNILERLGQPADHPTRVYHPEGGYLKGFILWVD